MNNEENPTKDLSKFGSRKRKIAAQLLTAYCETEPQYLGDGVAVWMNTYSGNVFLCDEDFNVAMMNGEKLEQFFSCPQIGHEGFAEEMQHNADDKECQEYIKEVVRCTK